MNKSRIPSLYPVLLLLFVLTKHTASAQSVTNQASLQKTSQQLSVQHAALQKVLLQTARQKGWPLTLRNKEGRLAFLERMDSRGFPIYVTTTDNIISAATIRTNTMWSGIGLTGGSITGSSAFLKGRIAVWDEGLVRPTHVELTGRVKQEDGATSLSDHSTHVSGTLIASGVNPVAKGMANGAQLLQTYDFDNDQSEMAHAAGATNGIIVSSHSYADIAGWYLDASMNNRWEFYGNPGDTVDVKFGLYDSDTQMWDSIAYDAPYYLISKAGGNNPGEQGPAVGQPYYRMNGQQQWVEANRPAGISNNAGFETIATYGNAKNILTLGAVNPIPGGYTQPSDVVIASFSSQGPSGDGRIKPDVVADGVNVLSSISTADNAYDIYSGTSMATPATAGSSFLLQEYYGKLHGDTLMYSATLKGLIIHTADEAGSFPGPDYVYGWGLVNLQKAAAVITADHSDKTQQIIQSSLTNSSTDSVTYVVTASGKMPVTATISWTDPPATYVNIPPASHNFQDTGIKLVNDLDLRIRDNTTGKVFMPWILDPKHPANAATKGDNIRDNVEKVELGDSLVPGRSYTVKVSHKGTLSRTGTQAFSLLMSGVGGTAYCTSGATSTSGTSITNVTVGNLNNNNAACSQGYVDGTGLTPTNLEIGQSFPISITYQNCSGTATTNLAIYIDANSNDTFDNNELVLTKQLTSGTTAQTYSGTITVPTTAHAGSLGRMRIIMEDGATPAACGSYGSGQTQDYTVVFTNPANDVGVTALEYPTSSTCASDSQLVSIHIHNFGSVPQTAGVPVTTTITGGSGTTTLTAICMDSIPAGGEVIYTYNQTFFSQPNTTYTFTSHTSLSTDLNTSNDSYTTSVKVNPAEGAGTGSATICGGNAKSVTLHANATEDDVALWYDSPTATVPIAAGNNTSTTEITPNKTYYLGLNDLQEKAGEPSKTSLPSSNSGLAGAYFRYGHNFIMFNTYVPLTIESAKMYIGHAGRIGVTLASLASLNNNTGEYSYYIIYSDTLNVYPTTSTPTPDTSQWNVTVAQNKAGTDTGGTFLLNIPIPNPGSYILMIDCYNGANAFLNANVPAASNPYPVTLPGVFSITGNDFRDYGKADSVTYSQSFYYPFYNIGLRLEGCPAATRTAITATTAASPTISQQGPYLVSSATAGNQWYLNDSLLVDSTTQQIQPSLPGVYYTEVTDPTTGCVTQSNSLTFNVSSTNPNAQIGLAVWGSPGPGYFKVMFAMTTTADLTIELYDMLGQRVWSQDYGSFTGYFNQVISTTLSSGMYVMKIIHGTDTYHYNIMIKRY